MKPAALIAAGAAVVSAAVFSCVSTRGIRFKSYTVGSEKLPKDFDGLKIFHLSDLHNKEITSGNKKLLSLIREANPDIIVMTGDMADRKRKGYDKFLSLCRGLPKDIPAFYVIGNHELYYEDEELSEMFTAVRAEGITILNNESVTLEKGKSSVSLYGMWYGIHFYKNRYLGYAMHKTFSVEEMQRLLGRKAPGFSVLLTHNPLDFPVYSKWGADLTLSGHIHGGFIELPKIGGLLSPERKLLPYYCAGEYFRGNHTLIISRGLGGARMIPAEASLIVLKRQG